MSSPGVCKECGGALPEGIADAACPSCLLKWGLTQSQDDSITVSANALAPQAARTDSIPRLPYFGDYELLEEIARGGMGVVYRARQVSLNRIVAVKMILAAQFAGKDAIHRFRTEAEAAARLHHPHIVGVHEVGTHEGFHYFSMDYIEGKSLAQVLRESGPQPARRGAEWVRLVTMAIEHAHAQGILHRDIKPSNILIDAQGVAHVTDFGLAKQIEGNSEMTVSGQILGSPNYMPPEQAGVQRGQIGRPSDVYSLGAVLYHALTGRPPFFGQTVTETVHAVVHQEVTPPRMLTPGIPTDLETICLKCLEKDPNRRYGTAAELAAELDRFLADEPILARPIGAMERAGRWCRRKPIVAALSASLVLVVLVGLIGVLTQWRRVARKNEESRQQLARLNVLSGVQLMQDGDYLKALLWFAEALRIDAGHKEQEELHRIRIASLLEQCPRLVQVLSHDGQPIGKATLSPKQDRLATIASDRTVRVWEVPSGSLLRKSQPLPQLPFGVSFSPDGKRLLVILTADHTVHVLDTVSAQPSFPALPHWPNTTAGSVFEPCFDSAAQRLLTQPRTNVLQLWDMRTGRAVGPLLIQSNLIERAQFTASGQFLFVRTEGPVNTVWDLATGETVPLPVSGFDAAGKIELSPFSDHALINGRIWKLIPSFATIPARLVATPVGEALFDPNLLIGAAFSPDGTRLITAKLDHAVQLWDLATAKPLGTPLAQDQDCWPVAFSPDGHLVLTVTADNFARVWDVETSEPVTPPLPHASDSGAVGFSSSGRFLLTMHPHFAACVWDLHLQTTPPAQLKPASGNGVNASGAQGRIFASRGDDNLIRIRGPALRGEVAGHPLSVKSAPVDGWFDDSGRFLVLEGEKAKVQIWEAATASGFPLTPVVQSQYTVEEPAWTHLALPSLTLRAERLKPLVELLAGRELDGLGAWRLITFDDMLASWEDIRKGTVDTDRSRPSLGDRTPTPSSDAAAYVGPSLVPLEAWHEYLGETAASAQDWFAAAFHREQLLQLHPDDSELRARRDYAQDCLRHARTEAKTYPDLRSVTPLRDPRASRRLIDLSRFYTPSSHGWFTHQRYNYGLRSGVHVFDGVPFDVRGVVEFYSISDALRGFAGPKEVQGIPITQRCSKLHFLHATGSMRWEKQDVATVFVHYVNGELVSFPITTQVQVGSEWGGAQPGASEAEIAWIGTTFLSDLSQSTVRLFRYSWLNPHPEWEIASLDIVVPKKKMVYILAGLTAE